MGDPVSDFQKSASIVDRALAEVKASIGSFLANEKILYGLAPRIDSMLQAPPVISDKAKILKGKSDALLTIQKDLETESLGFVEVGSKLKDKINGDPRYGFLKSPPSGWGLRQAQVLFELTEEVSSLTPTAVSLSARLLAQNKNVKNLSNETTALEKAASGSGALPRIEGLIQASVGSAARALLAPLGANLSKVAIPLGIVALVAGAIWFLPKNTFRRGK